METLPNVVIEHAYGRDEHNNCLLTYEEGRAVIIREEDWDYDHIVSALVSDKYPSDKMQAVVNNYLLDMTDPDGEFAAMQNWRKEAKAIAAQLLELEPPVQTETVTINDVINSLI